jgi:hypothetical protein
MIEEIFEDKKKQYDKNEYLRCLKKQKVDQKRRNGDDKYMNDQEYPLSITQLSVLQFLT